MRKLLSFIIVCIPLYVWGSESFSVKLSLYETPRYAMNTSYDESLALPPPPLLPKGITYFLEGAGGFVGGCVMGLYPAFVGSNIVAIFGFSFGIPTGVAIMGWWVEDKGSFWKSFLGTAVGLAGTVGVISIIHDMEPSPLIGTIGVVSISFPIIGAVWGYHL